MDINQTVDEVHAIAVNHGWWHILRTPLEIHALIHSEVSEATEEVREGLPSDKGIRFTHSIPIEEQRKPYGEAIELADTVIRIMDYFGEKGWDLEEALRLKIAYNKTRPYRHGGKLA